MGNRSCTEPDCDKPYLARGYCKNHYRSHGLDTSHGAKHLRTANCQWGGHEFSRMTSGTTQRMNSCSAECTRWLGVRVLVCPINVRECVQCGAPYTTGTAAKTLCSTECQKEWTATLMGCRNRQCADCGVPLGVFSLVTYCIECRDKRSVTSRREGSRTGKHRRRALMHGAEYERFNISRIYERDAWRCGVCGKRVDKTLAYPHRMSASLDHIVPIAHGGTHTKANVQLAHWICNNKKSDRLDVQPLLFD